MESTIHLWASSSKRKGYGLQILVKIVLGENSSLKIKKKKIYLSIRLERATELTWDLASLCSCAAISSSEQSSLRMGKVSREAGSERRKRSQEEALLSTLRISSSETFTFPENDTMCLRGWPREWTAPERRGWVILFPGPALSWLRGKGPTTLSAVAAAPWASPKQWAIKMNHLGQLALSTSFYRSGNWRAEDNLPQST